MRIATENAVVFAAIVTNLMLSGCISEQLGAARHRASDQSLACRADSAGVDFRYGRPSKVLDGTGWVFGIPRKLLLWDRRVDNHAVGDDTAEWIAEYAETQELDGLCVRVNQYDPVGEFGRLRTNQTVAPGWRYTFGTMTVIGYTLLPGRIFGGDQYNPFTNSVYIHSDVPALAVEATAYAQDVQSRSWPGTYAAVNELPFVSIWHETVNVKDAADFVEQHGTEKQRADGLRVLHSNYGSTVAFAVGAGPIAQIGAAVAGQFTGAFHASRLDSPATEEAVADPPSVDESRVRLASASTSTDR